MNPSEMMPTPFLSFIIRTQGSRIATLTEALLCLTAQSCIDFEIIIIGHIIDSNQRIAINTIIDETQEWLRERVRIFYVDDGNRTKPLNVGFSKANGQYITVFDDDDLLLSNFVEINRKFAKTNSGKILRSLTLIQDWETIKTNYGSPSVTAVSEFKKICLTPFNFFGHLYRNETPSMSLAFPNILFSEMGCRFDETLSTNEDWDFLIRASQLCDVVDTNEITSIYRYWNHKNISKSNQTENDWIENEKRIIQKYNNQKIVMPIGSFERIRNAQIEVEDLRAFAKIDSENSFQSQKLLNELLGRQNNESALNEKRYQLFLLFTSTSWQISRIIDSILRWILRKPKYIYPNLFSATEEQLDTMIDLFYTSKSWRMTAFLRKMRLK